MLCNRSHETVVFRQAGRPVFSLDGDYLVYVDSGQIVVAYSLREMAPRFRVSLAGAGQLTALPVHHRTVLVTVQVGAKRKCQYQRQCQSNIFNVARIANY